jgi:hypothetical protein
MNKSKKHIIMKNKSKKHIIRKNKQTKRREFTFNNIHRRRYTSKMSGGTHDSEIYKTALDVFSKTKFANKFDTYDDDTEYQKDLGEAINKTGQYIKEKFPNELKAKNENENGWNAYYEFKSSKLDISIAKKNIEEQFNIITDKIYEIMQPTTSTWMTSQRQTPPTEEYKKDFVKSAIQLGPALLNGNVKLTENMSFDDLRKVTPEEQKFQHDRRIHLYLMYIDDKWMYKLNNKWRIWREDDLKEDYLFPDSMIIDTTAPAMSSATSVKKPGLKEKMMDGANAAGKWIGQSAQQ